MLDDNHPIARLIPKEKRSDELEAALTGLNATDMRTLADALVDGYKAKTESEELRTQVTELESTMDDMVFIPDEDTPEEEVALYYEKAGIPEDIDGYGMDSLAKDEEGKKLLEAFVEAEIPKSSAEILTEKLNEINSGHVSKVQQQLESLKASMGEKDFKLAEKGAEILYPGEEKASIREKYLSDPDAIPGLAIAGKVGIEHGKLFNQQTQGGGGSLYPSMDKRGLK